MCPRPLLETLVAPRFPDSVARRPWHTGCTCPSLPCSPPLPEAPLATFIPHNCPLLPLLGSTPHPDLPPTPRGHQAPMWHHFLLQPPLWSPCSVTVSPTLPLSWSSAGKGGAPSPAHLMLIRHFAPCLCIEHQGLVETDSRPRPTAETDRPQCFHLWSPGDPCHISHEGLAAIGGWGLEAPALTEGIVAFGSG